MTTDEVDVPATADCGADHAAARARVRAFETSLRADEAGARRERAADRRLALEWFVLIAVTYGLIYGVRPVWLKAALLLPWSLYVSLALDNITHYMNHWPPFRSRAASALFRWSGLLVLFNPLEIRAIHHEHHRAYNRLDPDERPFGPADRGRSFGLHLLVVALDGVRLLWPWRAMDACVTALRRRRPREWLEVVMLRALMPAWFLALAILDWRDTLFFFLPSVIVIGSFGSYVMNLTDHIPGDPTHTFRLATWTEPRTPGETFFSAVNHQTCATHLTHHLFPRIHWVHLRALQAKLAPIYERQRAPRSLLVNSALVGNPLAWARVLREIARRRFDLE